jgi:hypothetical protein
MFEMNKRGHLATTMMFFGTFVLVGVGLFTFISFKEDFKNRGDLEKTIEDFIYAQRFTEEVFKLMINDAVKEVGSTGNFEDSFKEEFKKIAERRREEHKKIGNLFLKIIDGGSDLTKEGNMYVVEIKDVFVIVEKGNTVIRRDFDLKEEIVILSSLN